VVSIISRVPGMLFTFWVKLSIVIIHVTCKRRILVNFARPNTRKCHNDATSQSTCLLRAFSARQWIIYLFIQFILDISVATFRSNAENNGCNGLPIHSTWPDQTCRENGAVQFRSRWKFWYMEGTVGQRFRICCRGKNLACWDSEFFFDLETLAIQQVAVKVMKGVRDTFVNTVW
jgi:hypothetical protein